MNLNTMLQKTGRILAGKRIDSVRTKLKNAGFKINAEIFVTANFFIGFAAALAGAIAVHYWLFNNLYTALAFIGTGIVYFIFVNSLVGLFIDQRAKFVEKVFPDALLLMSSNLRSGVSPDEALLQSAKEEFGFLSDNIKVSGHRIATGVPIETAFKKISDGIDSDILTQTINLIIEGIGSGGELASILEGTARDIKDNEIIRKEIRSMIFVYAAFIFLAVAVISPILYAVSTELAGILARLSESLASGFLSSGSTTAGSIPISPTRISVDFLLIFSYANILITSVFGSLMMALINRGNEKYGLKYIPFVAGLAILLFNIGRIVMNVFFGSIRVL